MKVTKAQAQENRAHIVETASALFRERGYDGVGVAELMGSAGFTHGGFYKHFRSKADLMGQAAGFGILKTLKSMDGLGLEEFVARYLSREHRDSRSVGCTFAALSGDAARQSEDIKQTFADGMERSLSAFPREGLSLDALDQAGFRAKLIDMYAHVLGALVLSRACPDDSPLADEFLEVCRKQVLQSLPLKEGD